MPEEERWYVGDLWLIEVMVKDPKTGKIVEPGEVSATVHRPDGTTGMMLFTKIAEGVYESTPIELTKAGAWRAVVKTPAPYQASKPESIRVYTP